MPKVKSALKPLLVRIPEKLDSEMRDYCDREELQYVEFIKAAIREKLAREERI